MRSKSSARQSAPNGRFLSDPGRIVQQDLDIQEYTDLEHDPMIPHMLVLKPGLVIHKIYNGYWFWGRPSIEDLRQDLRAVTRESRHVSMPWPPCPPNPALPELPYTMAGNADSAVGAVDRQTV